jgi:hypothetical protein
MKKRNPHIGSNFDDFLKEEGIFEEVQAKALKSSVSHDEWMIEELRRDPKFAAEYLILFPFH